MTFANVVGILLENSNKTYPQHLLIRNLFSECLDDTLPASDVSVNPKLGQLLIEF
jgi:hypothetical protein